jgi:hypothetical protein
MTISHPLSACPHQRSKRTWDQVCKWPFSWLLYNGPSYMASTSKLSSKSHFKGRSKSSSNLSSKSAFKLCSHKVPPNWAQKAMCCFFVFFCMPTYFYSGFGPSILWRADASIRLGAERKVLWKCFLLSPLSFNAIGK